DVRQGACGLVGRSEVGRRLRLASVIVSRPDPEEAELMTDVAVIGSGNVGGTLARALSRAGHRISLGARDPDKPEVRERAQELGAEAASVAEAVRSSSVVLFAIPGSAMAETVGALGTALDGKIVIDTTNNVGAPVVNSHAAIAEAAPGASYVRAFNTVGWE